MWEEKADLDRQTAFHSFALCHNLFTPAPRGSANPSVITYENRSRTTRRNVYSLDDLQFYKQSCWVMYYRKPHTRSRTTRRNVYTLENILFQNVGLLNDVLTVHCYSQSYNMEQFLYLRHVWFQNVVLLGVVLTGHRYTQSYDTEKCLQFRRRLVLECRTLGDVLPHPAARSLTTRGKSILQ